MKRALCIVGAAMLLSCSVVKGQATPPSPQADTLGMHSMLPGSGSSVTVQGSLGCTYCHAPHSGIGGVTPLWNQTLSQQTYALYSSTTLKNQATQPTLGRSSSLCLSCHDGTVGVGQTAVYGRVPTAGSLSSVDLFGPNLSTSHPISMVTPLKDSIDMAASLVAQGKTADPLQAVKLIHGNVECISCHNPHVQGTDQVAQMFLVRDSSSGQMCFACHDPARTITGVINPLSGWSGSAHATSSSQVKTTVGVGLYGSVAVNACTSCHTEHNSNSTARLLRAATPAAPSVDVNTQDCITCHFGGTNVSPAAPNVFGEFNKIGHLLPAGTNTHDAAEPVLLNNNRHATCVDCHSAHAAQALTTFSVPPAIRPPQINAEGISGTDGATIVAPAVNQYETCLRCHGTSSGKQVLIKYGYLPRRIVSAADPLNLVPQFSANATSSHPVMHPTSSPLAQPSLLPYMLNQNGLQSARTMSSTGTSIFCTDCHSSDDNREFGGSGPNGPHGSIYPHILERNYQFSQAATPGGTVTNTYPTPDLSYQGPYAMCAKCHNLSIVVSNTAGTGSTSGSGSWAQHYLHVSTEGFSCSVCHTAHGMGATSPTITGERLVNFDVNVVAPNQLMPIAYNRATNSCTLTCHNAAHNANGSVSSVNGINSLSQKPRIMKP